MLKTAMSALFAVSAFTTMLPAQAADPQQAGSDLKVEDAKAHEKEHLEHAENHAREVDKHKEAEALKDGNTAEAKKYSEDAHARLEKKHEAKADVVADKTRHAQDEKVIHSQ